MFPHSAGKQPAGLADTKTDTLRKTFPAGVGVCVTTYQEHFIGELTPVK
jgi:hypothetical protein